MHGNIAQLIFILSQNVRCVHFYRSDIYNHSPLINEMGYFLQLF